MSIYSASKAAIDYFTLSLAAEVKEYNIAVNYIAPTGAVYSEGNLKLFKERTWIDTWEP
ncbi:MAG: SDR family NAD(P)-dependent oxidoreductase [Thermodesulfobacteriota bacterium]|nr:SDR family NAD(P)-dependent oxidoreductase [Thermodesulfobacteriota bacterium]